MISIIRTYAFVIGLAFVVAGIGGFIPTLTTQPEATAPHLHVDANYAYLLGLFPVNLVHNLFHFTAGVLGLWASRDLQHARRYCQGLGVILLVLTIMGMLPELSTSLGLLPLFGHDIWLHGLEAVLGLYLGFFWSQKSDQLSWRHSS